MTSAPCSFRHRFSGMCGVTHWKDPKILRIYVVILSRLSVQSLLFSRRQGAMEHLPQGVKEEEGCFVYRVLGSIPLAVRTALNVGDESKTNILFEPNKLVSVDLVRPSRVPGSENGPFLRLSDASG